MKVFIGWGGDRSKAAGIALRDWLPRVIQGVRPWMSEIDIGAGARWGPEVDRELSDTRFGILCVTADNAERPWLLFEAGAVAKTVDDQTRVVPYLIDFNQADLPDGPLTRFQAKKADRDGTRDVVCEINGLLEKPIAENILAETFEKWWAGLEEVLDNLPEPVESLDRPSSDEMLEDILITVRNVSRQLTGADEQSWVRSMRELLEASEDRRQAYDWPRARLKTASTSHGEAQSEPWAQVWAEVEKAMDSRRCADCGKPFNFLRRPVQRSSDGQLVHESCLEAGGELSAEDSTGGGGPGSH